MQKRWMSTSKMIKLHEFYRRFANLPLDRRNVPTQGLQITGMTPFQVYKQLEEVRKMKRYCEAKEDELLQIAEIVFNQVEN